MYIMVNAISSIVCALPVSRYYWKEPGSTCFATSLQVFVYIDNMPLEPSLLQTQSLLSQHSFLWEVHQSGAPHWTISSMSMTLLYVCICKPIYSFKIWQLSNLATEHINFFCDPNYFMF